MDRGIPQTCDPSAGAECTKDERYPGLWEVPQVCAVADVGGAPRRRGVQAWVLTPEHAHAV